LNLGAQLYWQFYKDPTLFERTDKIVTYPQYWAFLLTGAVAADVSSLGCHTDLWAPDKRDYSSLVDHMQLRDKLAAPENANKIIGTITPEICKLTGLPRHVPVACGIHDSNASLLPYLNTDADQYSVVSTGTWVIAMALNGLPIELDEALETFMNVDAFGRPVPSARFMGGREFELEKVNISSEYSDAEVQAVLDDQLMLLPAVEPMAGPFKGRLAEWQPYAPERGDPRRHIALSFYLALVTNSCLEAIGHVGKIVVEGPFARNELFLSMLKVASNSEVFLSSGQTGTSLGAALLFKKRKSNKPKTRHIIAPTWDVAAMRELAENWRYLSNSKMD
jgi:sugar (pentulose or hexulose) kinase